MHDGMPYGRIQGQGQGHSREVDRQSPTGLILCYSAVHITTNFTPLETELLRMFFLHLN